MSVLKVTCYAFLVGSTLLMTGSACQAQNRNTHRSNSSNMNGAGGTQMQSSVQAAQNQARSIFARQHQIWLAHRRAQAAKEAAAKSTTKTTETKDSKTDSTAKTAPEKSTASK